MFGYGRTSGLPYDECSTVGLDHAVMWWGPTDTGKGKLILDNGTGPGGTDNDTPTLSVSDVTVLEGREVVVLRAVRDALCRKVRELGRPPGKGLDPRRDDDS